MVYSELQLSHGAPTHHIRIQSLLSHRRKPGQCYQPAGSQHPQHLATTFGWQRNLLWIEKCWRKKTRKVVAWRDGQNGPVAESHFEGFHTHFQANDGYNIK
jgi:hypothetical protein